MILDILFGIIGNGFLALLQLLPDLEYGAKLNQGLDYFITAMGGLIYLLPHDLGFHYSFILFTILLFEFSYWVWKSIKTILNTIRGSGV